MLKCLRVKLQLPPPFLLTTPANRNTIDYMLFFKVHICCYL